MLGRGQVLKQFVELLEEKKFYLNKKGKKYPELTDSNWLNNLHFFCRFPLQ